MRLLLVFSFLFLVSIVSYGQSKKVEEVCYNPNLLKDTTKKSIKSMAVGLIGKDSIKITYHSPGVRKRIIWGGLVPLDEVWVTGAHNATNLIIDRPILVNNKEIPAGQYALFTIPGNDEWTVIINKHWEQHLATEYDEKDDILRFKVKPQATAHTERLQYYIEPSYHQSGIIAMAWEKIRIEFPFLLKR